MNKPQPCNSFWVNHFALFLVYLFLGILAYRDFGFGNLARDESDKVFLISLLIYVLPITAYELIVLKAYKRPTAGINFSLSKQDFIRVVIKLWGLAVTVGIVAFVYWLFPEYNKDLYQLFFRLCDEWLPYVVPVVIIYFSWIDNFMENPEDEYWNAGMFFLGRWSKVDMGRMGHHIRTWFIKGFFLPMMLQYLYGNYGFVVNFNFSAEENFFRRFDFIITLVYIADLIPACVGYIFNMKLFDNNIRSTDNTVRGWLVCLMCYTPIWHILMYSNYFPYMDGYNWTNWLGNSPFEWAKYVWAGLIIGALLIYSSASVSFGTRWSNLTYRGLMCTGAYRLTKHPAYVFKNLSWWLISIPFVVHGSWEEAIRQICLISCVNFIYYQRAVTEERHLSQWEEYREYANWMNQHSIFSWVGRLIPIMRYDSKRYGY